ncbi:hypothetical protein P7C70_g8224, partial [Phenoliferia sp. Uapishka_3]
MPTHSPPPNQSATLSTSRANAHDKSSSIMSATTTTQAKLARSFSQRVKPRGKENTPTANLPTIAQPLDALSPTDVSRKRLEELRRIMQSLQQYFEAISVSHLTQAKSLASLSGPGVIQVPLVEASIFLPGKESDNEGKGTVSWSLLLSHLQAEGSAEAEEGLKYAKVLVDKVVPILSKLQHEVKGQITALKQQVEPIAEAVPRLRAAYSISLAQLSKALSLNADSPNSIDPFVVRASVEQYAKAKATKENELVAITLKWQAQVQEFEVGCFGLLTKCLKMWEDARTQYLTANLQRCSATGVKASALAPDVEWKHFESLNLLLPATMKTHDLTTLVYPGCDDERTRSIKGGSLERKKKFGKPHWKEAYFIVTPSGHLHEYASSDSPLDKPHISLYLPHCTVGPIMDHELVQGETSSSAAAKPPPTTQVKSAAEAIRAATEGYDTPIDVPDVTAYKFLLEGRRAGHGLGEMSRFLRSSSKEELQGWLDVILKFIKAPTATPSPKQPKRTRAATVERTSEEIDGDGAPSDDEAFAEAREKSSIDSKEKTAPSTSPKSNEKGLLAKARSMKLPKLSRKNTPSAKNGAGDGEDAVQPAVPAKDDANGEAVIEIKPDAPSKVEEKTEAVKPAVFSEEGITATESKPGGEEEKPKTLLGRMMGG